MQTEHAKYFEALQQHPRLLVGQEVPAIGKPGTEILASPEDAASWQEAVKHTLAAEVRSRAAKAMEESSDFLNTVTASIDLFRQNTDLIPGTAEFDADLAKRFTELAEPYEIRVEGKLQGYSVPVQPLISQLRSALTGEREAKAAAASPSADAAQAGAGAAGAASTPAPAAAPSPPADPPQAGITSKPGGGAPAGEDFATLFGTISPELSSFRI